MSKTAKPKNVAEDIGLIELCFSGYHQNKEYQSVNTELFNNLIFTIKTQLDIIQSQSKEIQLLKGEIADLYDKK